MERGERKEGERGEDREEREAREEREEKGERRSRSEEEEVLDKLITTSSVGSKSRCRIFSHQLCISTQQCN